MMWMFGCACVSALKSHGIYAAAFLGSVTRVATELNVAFTNYFEPVNEGAIFVGPFSSQLTPVGDAMALIAGHAGGSLAWTSIQDDREHNGRSANTYLIDTRGEGCTRTHRHIGHRWDSVSRLPDRPGLPHARSHDR